MDIESLPPRGTIAVALLALLPALWYAVGRPSLWGFVTGVSTIVIIVALYIAMTPVAERDSNENVGEEMNS